LGRREKPARGNQRPGYFSEFLSMTGRGGQTDAHWLTLSSSLGTGRQREERGGLRGGQRGEVQRIAITAEADYNSHVADVGVSPSCSKRRIKPFAFGSSDSVTVLALGRERKEAQYATTK